MGVGAKIFTIAGPVIVYGVSEGVVFGEMFGIKALKNDAACDTIIAITKEA